MFQLGGKIDFKVYDYDDDGLVGPKATYIAEDEWTFDIKAEVGTYMIKNP